MRVKGICMKSSKKTIKSHNQGESVNLIFAYNGKFLFYFSYLLGNLHR